MPKVVTVNNNNLLLERRLKNVHRQKKDIAQQELNREIS